MSENEFKPKTKRDIFVFTKLTLTERFLERKKKYCFYFFSTDRVPDKTAFCTFSSLLWLFIVLYFKPIFITQSQTKEHTTSPKKKPKTFSTQFLSSWCATHHLACFFNLLILQAFITVFIFIPKTHICIISKCHPNSSKCQPWMCLI